MSFARLVAPLVFAAVAATACAESTPPAGSTAAAGTTSAAKPASTMVDRFREGQHYQLVPDPQPSDAPAGKVEVVEVFSYACVHCASFQAEVDAWRPKAPAEVHFTYLPAAWNSSWEAFARAYHAADQLGILARSHRAMFKAIHTDRTQIRNIDDLSQWYTQFGVTKEQFLAAFNSPETTAKIEKAQALVPAYGVDATPTVVVAGKYRITGEMAGSNAGVFEVAEYLVAKEAAGN